MRFFIFSALVVFLTAQAFATILEVPEEYESIQIAVNALSSGDTILVDQGEYEENITATWISFTLASQYLVDEDSSHINNTVIRSNDVQQFHSPLRISLGLEDSVVIQGLTITGGRLQLDGENDSTKYGGGVYVYGGKTIIKDCIITDNIARSGGGVYLDDSDGIIINNNVHHNYMSYGGGGIKAHMGEEAPEELYYYDIISNNIHHNGRADTIYIHNGGGGLSLGGHRQMECVIRNNVVTDNEAYGSSGGIWVACNSAYISTCIFENNIISRNESRGATGLTVGGGVTYLNLVNNTFEENHMTYIWAAALSLSSPADVVDYNIEGNVFVHNNGLIDGAIWTNESCHIHNNIFIGNRGRNFGAIMLWTDDVDSGKTVEVDHNIFIEHACNPDEPERYVAVVSPASRGNYIDLHHNDFFDNDLYAAGLHTFPPDQQRPPGVMFADSNYWGHPSGPYHPDENPDGLGDTVRANISILPFLTEPATAPHSISIYFPDDGAAFNQPSVLFWWGQATDPTTLEPLHYGVQLSTDPDFETFDEYPSGEDTTLTVVGLLRGEAYYWRIYAEDSFELRGYSEVRSFTLGIEERDESVLPDTWALPAPYPNPFNDSIRFSVAAPEEAQIAVRVYDLLGREVASVYRGEVAPGLHAFTWRPTNAAAGLYFLRLTTNSGQRVETKVVYVR